MPPPLPDPSRISFASLMGLSGDSSYPAVLRKTYSERLVRRGGPGKKQQQQQEDPLAKALADDDWRYGELPREVGGWVALGPGGDDVKKDGGKGNGKGQAGFRFDLKVLERLVGWKITHGASRPFLLGQIRQNDGNTVISAVRTALFDLDHHQQTHPNHTTVPSRPAILNALNALTSSLRGVGPATASLILSLYRPDSIPFFQDELFVWLCRRDEFESTNAGEGGDLKKVKLKYTVKEYEELLGKVEAVRERLRAEGREGSEEEEDVVPCWMLEKAAFVLFHRSEGDGCLVDGSAEVDSRKRKTVAGAKDREGVQNAGGGLEEQPEKRVTNTSSTSTGNRRSKRVRRG